MLPSRSGQPLETWVRILAYVNEQGCKIQQPSILTYSTIFSLEGMGEIYCHSSVFLIRPTPTHKNSLQANLKISIFWLDHPTIENVWKYFVCIY